VLPVSANVAQIDNEPAQQVIAWLKARLPSTWEVTPTRRAEAAGIADGRGDAAIDIRGTNGTYSTLLVNVSAAFGPRDLERLQGGLGRTLRALAGNIPLMVFTPWLSPRTQELLRSDEINYLDLTGNGYLRLENPTVYVETHGALKDPSPRPRGKARLQGPKAGRLVRTLLDVRPPYGVRDLAEAIQLTPGYVSRLLEALDSEALVQRSPRGLVTEVDVPQLLRHWAASYDVFQTNETTAYLAPQGAASIVPALASVQQKVVVSGSFAAARLAPVAAPALLLVYTNDPPSVAETLRLLPTKSGANVVLMRPFDPVVYDRTSQEVGVAYVSPSQAAADCLTGNGRMPAEGQALLEWMTANEARWQLAALSEIGRGLYVDGRR
jgi:Transcriptional regulator, AbiEi antitoxin, Type IV TA system